MRWFIKCLLREGGGRHSQPSTAPCPSPALVFGCEFLVELLSPSLPLSTLQLEVDPWIL